MKSRHAILLAVVVATLSACRPRQESSLVKSGEARPTFRDVLLGCLEESRGPLAHEMKNFVIYQPTDALLSAPEATASSAEALLGSFDAAMRQIKPSALYEKGVETPSSPLSAGLINAALSEKPVTVVVIPGLFGEFIEIRAFDEVFAHENSAYARDVAQKFAAHRESGGDDRAESYSLRRLGPVSLPLEQLVSVTSIDSDEGSPLVQVILLNTPPLSMESVGESGQKAALFTERLARFFKIAGLPDRIMLVGYSRGTPVALDMMADASPGDWRERVKAVVSLGGVVFGSALSDAAKDPESPAAKQLSALQELKDSLVEKKSAFVANSSAWLRFAKRMAAIANPGGGIPSLAGIEATYAKSKGVDLGSNAALFFRYYREFGLANPLSDYVANIQRFKRLVDEVSLGVAGLSTDTRLAWWRSHKIRTDGVRYYAVTAAMDDPTTSPLGDKLMTNPYTYDVGSYDYNFLVGSYNDYAKASGTGLNDSQVSILRAYPWPNLVEALNGQRPEGELLAVLGTHHWGLALKVVSKMANGQTNPFPRAELLKALAAYEALREN